MCSMFQRAYYRHFLIGDAFIVRRLIYTTNELVEMENQVSSSVKADHHCFGWHVV